MGKEYLVAGKTLENSNQKPKSEAPSQGGTKPKRKTRRFAIVAVVLVIVIIVMAAVLINPNGSSPKPEFTLVSHNGLAVENKTDGFYAKISFRVNNSGSIPGNVTVIFKVITPTYYWAGAQMFYLVPGQSVYSYKENIPVNGDPESDWVYQCFIQGQKAINYPHD